MKWGRELACLLALGLAGCAVPGAFSPLRTPDDASGASDLAAAVARDAAGPASAVVAARTEDGALLVAGLGARGPRWRVETPVDLPFLAGDLVLAQEGGRIVGRDLRDGRVRFREAPGGLELVGAAGQGDTAVAVLTSGVGPSPRSEVWSIRGGRVVRRARLPQSAGAPAFAARHAWVPWGSHHLSQLDAGGGERARLRWGTTLLTEVRAEGGVLRAGHHEVVTLGAPDVVTVPGRGEPVARAAAALGLDPAEVLRRRLPARPFRDGTRVPAVAGGFDDGAWLLWWPGAEGAAPPAALVAGRAAVALDAVDGAARWARWLPAPVVGAAAVEEGFVLVDREGTVVFLDASSGEPRRLDTLGEPLAFATITGGLPRRIDAAPDGPSPPGDGTSRAFDSSSSRADGTSHRDGPSQPGDDVSSHADDPVADGLERVLAQLPTAATGVGVVAAEALLRRPGAAATAALVRLCGGDARDPTVREWTCAALARRATDLDPVLEALHRRADALAGTRPPPLTALAGAVAAARLEAAVPSLVARLRDPATPSRDLEALAAALGAIGVPAASAPLEDFLRLYHADAIDEPLARALVAAVDALVALDGPLAAQLLRALADDPFTHAPLRAHALESLAALDD